MIVYRRGQAEMVGLILIVLLLAVGFMLYIKFGVVEQGNGVKARYEETQLGQSFVNSLVKSEMLCNGEQYTVEEVIQDIAKGTTRCDGTQSTEEQLADFVDAQLTATHHLWGRNYRLQLLRTSTEGGELLDADQLPPWLNTEYPEEEQCGDFIEHTSDYYLIQLYPIPGTIELRLDQCS